METVLGILKFEYALALRGVNRYLIEFHGRVIRADGRFDTARGPQTIELIAAFANEFASEGHLPTSNRPIWPGCVVIIDSDVNDIPGIRLQDVTNPPSRAREASTTRQD